MNSIRSYLVTRLFVGFILLLSLASILVYFISKRILESDFDARLFAKAQAVVASTSQVGNKIDIDWANLPQDLGPHGKQVGLIEILDHSGHHLAGDTGLSDAIFPFTDHAEYRNADSPQGKKLRVLTLSFLPAVEEDDRAITPTGIREKCQLIVGSDRASLDHSLNLMAGVLGTMSFLASIFSLGIVVLVLGRGLQPLVKLSNEVALIDEATLEKRIDLDSFPLEILPVAEKLNDLLCRLEISFARERRFSADVSHELRTPVAELRSLSEIMLRQPDLPVETRQAFQDVLDASCHMQELVVTLLQIVRNERGISALEVGKIDLCELLRAAWNSYSEKAKAKEVILKFDLPNHLWIESDARLLRLVFNNLFSNAVEYVPAGGMIEVGIRNSNDRPILGIQNTTQDVSPKELPHFFERFWRKDKARGNSEHMGLGLSLTEIVCKRLQIHLTVSMPTPNSVGFWLALPVGSVLK